MMQETTDPERREASLKYIRALAEMYSLLDPPPVQERDWQWRATRTLHDLETAPEARCEYEGDLYILPYPSGQYPDSMVQIALVSALREYAPSSPRASELASQLFKGMHRFYDPGVGTLRRYLPNVGEEKDYDAVDSWYIYHPMMNLARLALGGDQGASDLLMRSVEYGIRAAHHFEYRWPVLYKIQDFSVMQQQLDAGRSGQTDTGGLYAYLMLLIHELTGEDRYRQEADAALRAAPAGLDVMYQANLTAWGAAACARLWRLSEDRAWLTRSYDWLAGLFHYCRFSTSWLGSAVHFPTFFSNPCMYNSAYMAPLEDFECVMAFSEYLGVCGQEAEPAVSVLVREYCRYAIDRSWFYYPDQLPAEIVTDKHEAGIIRLDLSFPLEDLYPDGQKAGQVGQEIYGAGLAFVFAARPFNF
jgi:hypothetical protein